MFLPRHRSLVPSRALAHVPRWMRAFLPLGLVALGGGAGAQGEVDPNRLPTAWCHPDGSNLSFMDDTDDTGGDRDDFAVVRVVSMFDKVMKPLVVGVSDGVAYVGDLDRLGRGARGGPPTPFDGVLALGASR